MFINRKSDNALDPPPIAKTMSNACEVLRVWAVPGGSQQVTLRTTWEDPGAWGLMLVDIAKHASLAYAREGVPAKEALSRIKELFDAEWDAPTDEPVDVTRDTQWH